MHLRVRVTVHLFPPTYRVQFPRIAERNGCMAIESGQVSGCCSAGRVERRRLWIGFRPYSGRKLAFGKY